MEIARLCEESPSIGTMRQSRRGGLWDCFATLAMTVFDFGFFIVAWFIRQIAQYIYRLHQNSLAGANIYRQKTYAVNSSDAETSSA